MEGKINKQLKKVLKKIVKEAHEPLAVADAKLGGVIKVRKARPSQFSMPVRPMWSDVTVSHNVFSQSMFLLGIMRN